MKRNWICRCHATELEHVDRVIAAARSEARFYHYAGDPAAVRGFERIVDDWLDRRLELTR